MARPVTSVREERAETPPWLRAVALSPLVGVLIAGLIVLVPGARVARAELIRTEAVLAAPELDSRAHIAAVLARDDVRAELASYGVSLAEAQARVAALTDSEAKELAHRIGELPAGADATATILIVAVVAFMALLVSDALGYTDIFPWVSKTPGR